MSLALSAATMEMLEGTCGRRIDKKDTVNRDAALAALLALLV